MSQASIYHIAYGHDWSAALETGAYAADSLQEQGFIHASTQSQVMNVANAFYRAQQELVLLVIDPEKLAAPLRWEPPVHPKPGENLPPDTALFPHIYGKINLEAVIEVRPFPPQADGTFRFPEA